MWSPVSTMKLFIGFVTFLLTVAISQEANAETRRSKILPRIVGGTWAKRGVYPFQAALFDDKGRARCSGSLIDQSHVLSSASCLKKYTIVKVVLKTTSLKPLDNSSVSVPVKSTLLHPKYNPTTLDNDIAIITLSSNVTKVRPIKLPVAKSDPMYTNRNATYVGWGSTVFQNATAANYSLPLSNRLKHLEVAVLSNQVCDGKLKSVSGQSLTTNQICTSTQHNKGMCALGDFGAPLLTGFPKAGNQTLIGIYLSAYRCGDSRYPDISLKVYNYLDWIAQNTKG